MEIRSIVLPGLALSIFVFQIFLFSFEADAQSGQCDAATPFFLVDLTGNPDSIYVSSFISRQATCCGASSPDRCIEFEIHLGANSTGLVFGIDSGAIPPGSLHYQVNCGALISVGDPICLAGQGPHFLTFCKPGANSNSYFISPFPINPVVPNISLKENCHTTVTANGFDLDSVLTWKDVTAGSGGVYESFFSCTTGCSSITLTSQPDPPPFIDYEVCGWVRDTICNLSFYTCDTGRINIVNPYLSVNLFDPTCNNYNNGFINLTVNNLDPPYSFEWSNGANTEDMAGLTAGMYIVTVTDAGLCGLVDTFVLSGPLPIQIDTNISHVTCQGLSNGAIDVIISGGIPPFEYLWSTGDTTEDLSGLNSGVYDLSVLDNDNCGFNLTGIVVLDDTLRINLLSVEDATCNGFADGMIDISIAGGTMPMNYSWSNGQSTQDATSLLPGSYSVTVVDSTGCTDSIGMMMVLEPPPLALIIDTISEIICPGVNEGLLAAIISGGVGNYVYNWSDGQINDSALNLYSGFYSVTVMDSNGCQISDTSTLADAIQTFSYTSGGQNLSCYNSDDGLAAVDTSGNNGALSILWSNGLTTDTISGLTSGQYSVAVADSLGCTVFDTVVIIQPDSIMGNEVISQITCFGDGNGSIALLPSGGNGNYTFNWSTGAAGSFIQDLSQGTYTAAITDSDNCLWSDSFDIVEPPPLQVYIWFEDPSCYNLSNGQARALAGGGVPPYNWYWSNGHQGEQINELSEGMYMVTVMDANDCSYLQEVNIVAPDTPRLTMEQSLISLQLGEAATITYTHDFLSGNLQYTWSPSTGLSCDDCPNPMASPFTYTEYTLEIFDNTFPDNPCSVAGQVLIDVNSTYGIYVPNAFTPNGDGENDLFQVYGNHIANVDLMIFNKLGIKVYDSMGNHESWNGTYKGVLQNPGVYVYYSTVNFLDGVSKEFKGSVSLIR